MRPRLLYLLFILFISISCQRVGTSRRYRDIHVSKVRLELPSIYTSEQVIEHLGFTTSYNSATLNPDWVAYELTYEELQGNNKGKSSFCWDPDVKGRKSRREDYTNDQGWDKGHMAPKADMKWSIQAYEESFYLSNICPQNHELNAGPWLKTENLARRMAMQYCRIYIICGPVYNERRYGTLGDNAVWIPDGFFKAFLVPYNNSYESLAFYMPNSSLLNQIREYACTVDDIEKIISRDLFPMLENGVEDFVESQLNYSFWGI